MLFLVSVSASNSVNGTEGLPRGKCGKAEESNRFARQFSGETLFSRYGRILEVRWIADIFLRRDRLPDLADFIAPPFFFAQK
jgi:hypothetical protein